METGEILELFRQTIGMILKLALPLLLVSISIGLLVSIFQAATQIHEQTLTFVPKIIAIALVLVITGSWNLTHLTEFFQHLMIRLAGL